MGLENFNPTLWSAKMFVRLRKAHVFAGLVNNDYEGEIKDVGDSVKILEIGEITISDYTKYSSLTWQELEGADKTLLIDQGKSFSFVVDDVDMAQNKPKVMNTAMGGAAYAVADTIDAHLAGMYAYAGVTNATYLGTSAAPLSTSTGNVIERVSYAGRYLTEANVPTIGRVGVIPPWFHQKLLLAEVGGISAIAVPKVFDDGMISSGYIGQALGFTLFVSNNIQTTSTANHTMWFNRSAISHAGQIAKVKAVEREDYFDEGVKGLYVYGTKVVRPNALAVLHAAETAG